MCVFFTRTKKRMFINAHIIKFIVVTAKYILIRSLTGILHKVAYFTQEKIFPRILIASINLLTGRVPAS